MSAKFTVLLLVDRMGNSYTSLAVSNNPGTFTANWPCPVCISPAVTTWLLLDTEVIISAKEIL